MVIINSNISLSSSVKPVLLLKPEDVSVELGESAQFSCKAEGDPMPSVEWSREQGPLPNGRSEKHREHWGVWLTFLI